MENNFKVMLETMIDNSSLSDVQKKLAKERLKIGADISVEDFAKSKREIEKQISGLAANIKTILGDAVSDKQTNQWAKSYYDSMISGAKQAVKEQEKLSKAVQNIQSSMNGKSKTNYELQIDEEIKKFRDLGFTEKEAAQKVKALSDAHAELKNVINSTDFDSVEAKNRAIIAADEKRTTALNQVRNAYKELKTDASQYYNLDKQTKLSNNILNWLSKNTRASKEARQSLQEYYRELSNGRVSVDRLEYIEKQLKDLDAQQRVLGRLGKSLKDQFKQAAESFGQWLSVSSLVMLGVQKTREAVTELKELDNILTEISKTSDLTDKQLAKLGDTAFDKGSKYGRTASDYLTGVQEMSRSGFYGKQGESMAEQSLLAQAAGDMTADTANKYILATNAAYKYNGEASKLNRVLDGQNMITNRNSVAMEDMAVAMSEAGTVASSYRVSIEDLSAMIGVIESVTKMGGSEVGTGINSLLINLQNITSSKIVKTLNAANASMTEMVNGAEKLRNPIAILRDLAVTFNKLDEDDPLRAEILTNIGQKYHATKLSALLQNMGMYDKMLKDYSEGEGSAFEEAQKSANNLTGSLNRLSNTWTGTVNNIVNSKALTTGVNTLNGLLGIINQITDALGSWGSIGLGAGIFAGFKNVGRPKMYGLTNYCFEIADNIVLLLMARVRMVLCLS